MCRLTYQYFECSYNICEIQANITNLSFVAVADGVVIVEIEAFVLGTAFVVVVAAFVEVAVTVLVADSEDLKSY